MLCLQHFIPLDNTEYLKYLPLNSSERPLAESKHNNDTLLQQYLWCMYSIEALAIISEAADRTNNRIKELVCVDIVANIISQLNVINILVCVHQCLLRVTSDLYALASGLGLINRTLGSASCSINQPSTGSSCIQIRCYTWNHVLTITCNDWNSGDPKFNRKKHTRWVIDGSATSINDDKRLLVNYIRFQIHWTTCRRVTRRTERLLRVIGGPVIAGFRHFTTWIVWETVYCTCNRGLQAHKQD